MAIIFSCECGRKLHVDSKLAGKKGKCPQCGAILVIPNASDAVVEEPVVTEEAQAPTQGEAGNTQPCPHCKELIPVGSVFCTKCGTDLRTGEKHDASGKKEALYNFISLAPDLFGKPAHAVGVIVESPLSSVNFMRAVGLFAIGLIGFTLLWVTYSSAGYTIKLGPNTTQWYWFLGFPIAGFLVLVVDSVMASQAGSHFGSTGTTMAQTVMCLTMTNAVCGIVSLVFALLILYGRDLIGETTDTIAMIIPWVLLAWSAWLTTVVIHRAYDTSQVLAVMFGVGTTALKGFIIAGMGLLMGAKF